MCTVLIMTLLCLAPSHVINQYSLHHMHTSLDQLNPFDVIYGYFGPMRVLHIRVVFLLNPSSSQTFSMAQ